MAGKPPMTIGRWGTSPERIAIVCGGGGSARQDSLVNKVTRLGKWAEQRLRNRQKVSQGPTLK